MKIMTAEGVRDCTEAEEAMIRNGYKASPEEQIARLKQLLSGTDYKAIKYAEGQIDETEYYHIREQRQAWRDEINRLESEVSDEIQ